MCRSRTEIDSQLPEQYRIMPYSVDFKVPGFETLYHTDDKTLSLTERNTSDWFDEFVTRIEENIAVRHFLPIMRMSDGEYKFCVGEQPPDIRLPKAERFIDVLRRQLTIMLKHRRHFTSFTH